MRYCSNSLQWPWLLSSSKHSMCRLWNSQETFDVCNNGLFLFWHHKLLPWNGYKKCFLFLCFTYITGPQTQLCYYQKLMMLLVIKHFIWFIVFILPSFHVDHRCLQLLCIVLCAFYISFTCEIHTFIYSAQQA